MASLISAAEKSSISSIFSSSFDTWSRAIIVYKEALKVEVNNVNDKNDNLFGFGNTQQTPIYTYLPSLTGVFMAIIKDSDIVSTKSQANTTSLVPETMARIIASPISIKVKRDAYDFIEDGETSKIVDAFNREAYILDGHGCLQTFQGTEYYIYPLRKTV